MQKITSHFDGERPQQLSRNNMQFHPSVFSLRSVFIDLLLPFLFLPAVQDVFE